MIKRTVKIFSVFLAALFVLQILPVGAIAQEVSKLDADSSALQPLAVSSIQPDIVCELENEREIDSKTFLRADGSKTAVLASSPLHYEKDGQLLDIDNTLVEEVSGGETKLVNKSNSFKVELPRNIANDNSVCVENKGYSLVFSSLTFDLDKKSVPAVVSTRETDNSGSREGDVTTLSNVLREAKFDSKQSAVKYENVKKDTDLQYVITELGLKENIILNKKPFNSVKYTFSIIAEGLTGKLNLDKSVQFSDPNGEIIFILPAPFMYDSAYEVSYEVAVEFTSDKQIFNISYSPSTEWLGETERKYPVTIDPAVYFSSDSIVKDAGVTSNNPNSTGNNATFNCVAYEEENGTVVSCEVLYKLDNSFRYNCGSVTNVTLNLCSAGYGSAAAVDVTEAWNESTVTYNTRPSYSAEVLDYIYIPVGNDGVQTLSFDVTQAYADGFLCSDDGVAIVPFGSEATALFVVPTEFNTSGSGFHKPYFTVDYIDANFFEGNADTHTFNAGRAGTLYVNDFSHKSYLIRDEVGIDGNLAPVSVKRHFNSNGLHVLQNPALNNYDIHAYGNGWLTNYNQFVFVGYGEDFFGYCNEYGDTIYLEFNESKSTTSADAFTPVGNTGTGYSGLTLYCETVNDEAMYIETSGNKRLHFSPMTFRLIKIEDINNEDNCLSIEYVTPDGYSGDNFSFEAISKITDGAGRELRFVYNSNGALTSITAYEANGSIITVNGADGDVPLSRGYTYSVETVVQGAQSTLNVSLFTGAVYPDGESVSYLYHENSLNFGTGVTKSIQSITDISGYTLVCDYDDYARVSSVSEKSSVAAAAVGNVLCITKSGVYQSSFESKYGSTASQPYAAEVKAFDKYARTVSVRNSDNKFVGVVYSPAYGDTGIYRESITDIVSTLGTNSNLLSNGDFSAMLSGSAPGWSGNNLSPTDICMARGNSGAHTVNVFRINGDPGTQKSISQSITLSASKGDILSLGGWAKATAISSGNSAFGLKLQYHYNYTTCESNAQTITVTETVPFSDYIGDWQFNAAEFVVENDITSVTIYAEYAEQCNTACFADLQLTLTEAVSTGVYSACICGDACAFGTGCPCECASASDCACEQCAPCLCTGCLHSLGDACNCTHPELCQCAQCEKCTCADCNHIIGDACNCTGSSCTCPDCRVCVCGENCAYAAGCPCECASASVCECEACQALSACPCADCEVFSCECTCVSAEACSCVQCKRRRIYLTDSIGNVTVQGKFDGQKTLKTQTSFTPDGNYITNSCDSAGNMVQFSYNQDNGVLNAVTDGNGGTLSYSYNAMRELTGVSQLVSNLTNGTSISNTCVYDDDRLVSITHNGFSYNFEYDVWGNITASKVGSQALASYTYGTLQNRDRLGTVTYGNAYTVTYSYDSDNNITGISYDGGSTFAYEYEYTDGKLTGITDNMNGCVTSYANGNTEISENGVVLFSTWTDANGNYTESSNGTTYAFTSSDCSYNQTTGESISGNAVSSGSIGVAFCETSDWFSRLKKSSITVTGASGSLGSAETQLTYKNASGSRTTDYVDTYTSTAVSASGASASTVYGYSYDNNGNIKSITGNGELKYTYNYDEAGQLVRSDDAVQDKSFVYAYDVGGNIRTRKEYPYTVGSLGTAVDTVVYSYDNIWKDKLISFDGKNITYDAIGNPLSYDGSSFDWNGRELYAITNSERTLSFKYNENGLRSEKKITIPYNGNMITAAEYSYVWNDDKLVSQSDGTNTMYFLYAGDCAPAGFVYNASTVYLYTKNLQGDVTGIVNQNGEIVAEYTYDAWGKLVSVKDAAGTEITSLTHIGVINPIRYRGYYYDTETGLYYLQSRYYNPEWGRFLNADKYLDTELYGFGSNGFGYCENNAINVIDPKGTFKSDFHYQITLEIAKQFFSYYFAELIAYKCNYVDVEHQPVLEFYSPYEQSYHFNINSNKKWLEDSRVTRANENIDKGKGYVLLAKLTRSSKKRFEYLVKAFGYFGEALHSLQDMVAHSGPGGNIRFPLDESNTHAFYAHTLDTDDLYREYEDTGMSIRTVGEIQTFFYFSLISSYLSKRDLLRFVTANA